MMPFCNARVHKTGIDHLIIFLSGRGYNIILQYTTARATHIIMMAIIIIYIYIPDTTSSFFVPPLADREYYRIHFDFILHIRHG